MALKLGWDIQGHDIERFKTFPTPDVIKLLDRVKALDTQLGNSTYVGCFNTDGWMKRACPIFQGHHTTDFGLAGTYIRIDYPGWIFIPGMRFDPANATFARTDLAYDIPSLLSACDQADNCNLVNIEGFMSHNFEWITFQRYKVPPVPSNLDRLGGMWIRRSFAESVNNGLGLTPQPVTGI